MVNQPDIVVVEKQSDRRSDTKNSVFLVPTFTATKLIW